METMVLPYQNKLLFSLKNTPEWGVGLKRYNSRYALASLTPGWETSPGRQPSVPHRLALRAR
jgi:hypothetical protein